VVFLIIETLDGSSIVQDLEAKIVKKRNMEVMVVKREEMEEGPKLLLIELETKLILHPRVDFRTLKTGLKVSFSTKIPTC